MSQTPIDRALADLVGDPPDAALFTQLQVEVYEQCLRPPIWRGRGDDGLHTVYRGHACFLNRTARYGSLYRQGHEIMRINLTHFRERLTRGALAHSTAVTILTDGERRTILERDGFRCRLCGLAASDGMHVRLEVDHITPRCYGGLKDPSNLWTLCYACNQGKGDRAF